MRLRLVSSDGREIGYVTDSPEFEYDVDRDAPERKAVLEVLEKAEDMETRPAYGGADDPDSACGSGREPATDADKLIMVTKTLSGLPVRIERDGE